MEGPSLGLQCQVDLDQELKISETLLKHVTWKKGRLHRVWLPQDRQVSWEKTMELAHDILGVNMTRQRLLLNFYWPK